MTTFRFLLFSFILGSTFAAGISAQETGPTTAQAPTRLDGKRFISNEGGFSVQISSDPSHVTDFGTEAAKKKGIDVGKQYLWKFETTTYTIMYSPSFDSNGNPMTQTLEDVSSGTRKGLSGSGAKLLSERPITFLNKYPGIEFQYLAPEGAQFVNRSFFVGSVGYQVVGAFIDTKDEKKVLETLDSFRLLSK